MDMIPTDAYYKKARIWLETDEPSLAECFERDSKWDHPLIKVGKKDKANDRHRQRSR